ncbi:MAG TPA: 50S ribosomal protein L15 [Anaerolineae bacterium]|nr:50S ribosomal protein L15 [Anaerolineae bacterium]HIQ05816.1 50S ribosomal protein L15 [Anaerolineae bacterium]
MRLHDLRPPDGARKKRTRVGRGIAAGKGKTAGRGTKGQNARSGGGVRPYFEGGQLPLVRRLPHKRGFKNIWKTEYALVNLKRLSPELFPAGSEVTPQSLAEAGLVKSASQFVAILGDGDIDRPLTVRAHRFSRSAQSKIEAAGGTVEVISMPPKIRKLQRKEVRE